MKLGQDRASRARCAAACTAAFSSLAVSGCSPALNWREVRLEGPGLVAMFPCRPVAQTREVVLAGLALSPRLDACESDGGTYAVMAVDVHDPAEVGAVLNSLRDSSLAKLGSPQGASAASDAWQVAGMTPQPAAGRWTLTHVPAGRPPVRMDTAVFARGTWVVQASVIGSATATGRESEPFFEGLRFVR
ncbi:hypothetical protein [Ideonella sp. YS5]|uniref:hypothetical protein n=1 Tax=Ideonella sp. YS5 TaxID=3453714 RepID=UPI003EEB9D26